MDTWWRARPSGPPFGDWVTELVSAAFAGGADLGTPRFLLARTHDHWATGVACAAAELDASMSVDDRGRDLFAFVGWISAADGDPVVLPGLADWVAHRTNWAGATYTTWCRPDWEMHYADAAIVQPSVPEDPPWSTGIHPGSAGSAPLITDPARVALHPEADAARLWTAGVASTEPFVLVTGWPRADALDVDRLTHATVRGLSEPAVIVRRGTPSVIVSRPAPAPEPGDDIHPDPSVAVDPGRRRGFRELWTDVVMPPATQAELRALRDDVDRCLKENAELRARVDELTARLSDRQRGTEGGDAAHG
ncbi:hypothetical protein KOI35_26300 [Actinoplanes bogorensis]|uniref:Uncharacterized protein n=1 Tax=Paractinoplanes bogorensis TaxID=1610840 RepID=A0ABS5YU98_9ACTN|nr:hypothetical protein [Actinoplanes bogorensis]MBU2667029.1 hypothetical protein [Actinoplanes bogorensis]